MANTMQGGELNPKRKVKRVIVVEKATGKLVPVRGDRKYNRNVYAPWTPEGEEPEAMKADEMQTRKGVYTGEKSPELKELAALRGKGWSKLDKEERARYQELKAKLD